jgi:hypothetical protein
MSKSQTPHETEADPDSRVAIEFHKIDRQAENFIQFWKTVRWVSVALFVYLSIDALAGRTTLAEVAVKFFALTSERGVSKWWVAAAGLFCVWAVLERTLRLRKVSSMSKRMEALEKKIDSNRTSSGLTRTGETPTLGKPRGE